MDKYDKILNKITNVNSFLDDITIMSKDELNNVMEIGLEKFDFSVEKYIYNVVMDIKIKYEDLEESKYTKILNDLVKKIIVFIKGWIFKYPQKRLRVIDVPNQIEKYIKAGFDENVWVKLTKAGVGGESEEEKEGDESSDSGFDSDFGSDDAGFGGGDEAFGDAGSEETVDVDEF